MGLAAPSGSSQSTASGISSLHFTSPHLTWGGCHPYLEGWYTLLWGIPPPPPNTNITLHFRVKSLRWERSASAAQLRKKHVSVFSPQSWGCNPLSGDMLRSLCSCFAFYAFPPSITSFFSSPVMLSVLLDWKHSHFESPQVLRETCTWQQQPQKFILIVIILWQEENASSQFSLK